MKELGLTQNRIALVDDGDYERLSDYHWSVDGYGYPGTNIIGRVMVRLHRLLVEAPMGMKVDHKDGNPMNNVRTNLRLATQSQNGINRGPTNRNTSGYKGVYWHPPAGKWCAEIHCDGKKYYLGLFVDIKDAAHAYNEKALELFGEFAWLNPL